MHCDWLIWIGFVFSGLLVVKVNMIDGIRKQNRLSGFEVF